ncbi:prickle-like protein 4 [Myotis daubentonii]|uniref:prickle-like protein 4 n=1 Tax=Myotis daubentonii TaxID=98922 RepID=UPI00287300D5|nr:prickle-like protein 4 [Myotis daubentonii]
MGAVGPRAVPAPPPPAPGSAIRRSAADGSGDCSAVRPRRSRHVPAPPAPTHIAPRPGRRRAPLPAPTPLPAWEGVGEGGLSSRGLEAGAAPWGGDSVRGTRRRGTTRTAQTPARREGESPAESRLFSKLPAARLGTPADRAPHHAACLQGQGFAAGPPVPAAVRIHLSSQRQPPPKAPLRPNVTVGETLPSVLVLNPGWPHRGEGLTAGDAGPPANFDSGPGHLPEEDLEETSAQDPEVLSPGLLGLDTKRAPNWPGLQMLLQQLPPQDGDERYCLALGEEELAELRLFCAQRRREALGQGVACPIPPKLQECTCGKISSTPAWQCRERLRPGEYGVFAARAGEQPCWHQACFACQACGQALMNRIYFYHDGHLYCGRHHAELLRPRCPACDQLIFSPRCTEAEGWRWHENHFCCQDCAGPLGGGRYAWPGGGPRCPTCFESRYSDAGWSLAATLEGRPPLGEAGPGRAEGGDRAPLPSAAGSGADFAAAAGSSPESQRRLLGSSREQESPAGDKAEVPRGRGQGPLETSPAPPAPLPPTQPEGFFLGQRLPRPRAAPRRLQAGDSGTSRKRCTVC